MIDQRRSLMALALVACASLLLAACGGAASPGASSGGASSEPSAAASTGDASSEPNPSVSIDLGGGSVPEGFEDKLIPPNSTYTGGFSSSQGGVTAFTSTASIDELKSFYDAAIASLGVPADQIFKTEAAGGFSWIFGEGDKGGLVIVAPNSDGQGSVVSVTYGVGG